MQTTDKQYTLQLQVSPNRFGNNTFTVQVHDSQGKPATNVGVTIYTTMLDMDMGTDFFNLTPTGGGKYSSQYEIAMAGHWQLLIKVRVPDNTLHQATIDLDIPF